MRRITWEGDLVAVDFRGCGARELFELYHAFGLMCAREEVRCALLTTGNEDADAHYALRDVLATVACIAGVPLSFRLALVATCEPIARVYRTVQRNLDALGCEARVFSAGGEAERWLRAGEPRARSDPGAGIKPRRGTVTGPASQGAASLS